MRYKALKAAFPYTLPIFTGFWFLGMEYSIYANASGFSFLYPMFMSLLIYGGSLDHVCCNLSGAMDERNESHSLHSWATDFRYLSDLLRC